MNLFAPKPPEVPERCGHARVTASPRSKAIHPGAGVLKDFDFVLNAYRGCAFGCAYCYAAFFVADFKARADWGNWVEVKTSALEEVEAAWFLKGRRLYMSSATDPYQPVEAKLGLTRQILELLAEEVRQPRLVIQTRGPLVTRDIDLLSRFKDVRVNMSVTTDSEAVRKQFEPTCASIPRRLEAVRTLADAGIRTRVCVSPMLPIESVAEFADRLLESGADQVVASPFHVTAREFAANTREGALKLAQAVGWKRENYLETVAQLRSKLPIFTHLGDEGREDSSERKLLVG
jgi:DNA repair photolyase